MSNFTSVVRTSSLPSGLRRAVPERKLHRFIFKARNIMQARPTPWWEIPIKVDVQVGPNFGKGSLKAYEPPRWRRFRERLRGFFQRLFSRVRAS